MASNHQYRLEVLLGARKDPRFKSSINGVRGDITSLSSSAKKTAALITGAFATVNVTGKLKEAMDVYAGFEQEMANTAAIAGASALDYSKMEAAAREAGKSTTKTAQESAAALGYMSLTGWDANQSVQSLMPVLKLSEATKLDLAEASDLVTDSMSALEASTKELPQYLDLVVKGNNSANTSSEQLMKAFIKTGGAARTLNMPIYETGTALGILANNGTKAEEGGRTLNAILTRIGSNENAVKQMKKLGISIFDAKGNFVGFEEALKRINGGLSGLSAQEKTMALKNIAGTNYYSKMAYLLDGVKEGANGAESAWDNLEDKLKHSGGALDEMDEKVTNTVDGAMKRMQSAAEDVGISFGGAFRNEYIEILTDLGEGFNNVSEDISQFAEENEVAIHQTFEGIKEDVVAVGTGIGNTAQFIMNHFEAVASGVAAVGTALATYKVANGIMGIVGSLGKLQMSPIGILTMTASGIAAVGTYLKKTHEKAVKANLDEHFGNISLSLEELDEISQEIVGKKQLVQLSEMLESVANTDESIGRMTKNFRNVEKISWKMHAGFEIDQNDKELYLDSAKEYMKAAQETLDNQGYTVSVATKFLLGGGSKIEKENNAFYSGLDAQLNNLQKRLNKKISSAVKNGVDIDTDEAIQKLLKKTSKITEAVTEAENQAKLQSIGLKYSGKDMTADDFKQLTKDIKKYEKEAGDGALKAYENSMGTLNARRNMGDISQKKYTKEANELKQQYYNKKVQSMTAGSEYIMNTIKEAYGPEVEKAMQDFQSGLDKGIKEAMESGASSAELGKMLSELPDKVKFGLDVSGETKSAIAELNSSGLGDIKNDMRAVLQQMNKEGLQVPKSLSEGINKADSLSAISSSTDDMYATLADAISNNDKYSTAVLAASEMTDAIPNEIVSVLEGGKPKVLAASHELVSMINEGLNGQAHFSGTVSISASAAQTALLKAGKGGGKKSKGKAGSSYAPTAYNNKMPELSRNAKGGIYKNPILTTFAEEGPEAAIPLDGSNRAKALWRNAGALLGMKPTEDMTLYNNVTNATKPKDVELLERFTSIKNAAQSSGTGTGGGVKIHFNPVIEIKGNADEKTVMKAVKMSQAEFAQMMERYLKQKNRVSFHPS